MATNRIKAIASLESADVLTQAEYEALPDLGTGFQTGILSRRKLNKALKQTSVIAAAVAQVIVSSGSDVSDDMTPDAIATLLRSTLAPDTTASYPHANVFDHFTPEQRASVLSGDLAVDVSAAVMTAIAADRRVWFPAGKYWLGTRSSTSPVFDLSALGADISLMTGGGAEFVVQTVADTIPIIFYLRDNNRFRMSGGFQFLDTGYIATTSWRGACAIQMYVNSTSWGDVQIDAIYSRNMVASVMISGGNISTRLRGVDIGLIDSNDCYYGFNAQNQGDGVRIGRITARQNYRPYFVYGVTDHDVTVYSENSRGTSGAINISRSPGGLDTTSIRVNYTARNMAVNINHVLINHIDLLGGSISDIRVHVDIRSSAIYTPVHIVNYTGSGGSETSAASLNRVTDVRLSGTCDVQANPVSVTASLAAKDRMEFVHGERFFYDTSVPNAFYLSKASRPTALTWSTSGTQPTIGNGTITASTDLIEGICSWNLGLVFGSTTSGGTGEWRFSLPWSAKVTTVGAVFIVRSGVAYYTGSCCVYAGHSEISGYTNAATTGISGGSPHTWAVGDRLVMSVAYPIS